MIPTVQTNNKELNHTTIENNSNAFSLFSSTNDHHLRKYEKIATNVGRATLQKD